MIKFPFLTNRASQCRDGMLPNAPQKEQHQQEREQFQTVLQSFHATRIEERLAILDIFLATEQHLSLSELERLITDQAPGLRDRAFLKETMEMFCRFGFAQEQIFENREPQYEHHHLGAHHDHFICTRCGLIQEFVNPDMERLQLGIAKQFGFHPLQHKMEIYGLCTDCMESRDDTIPLLMAANGEKVRIVHITGDRPVQARLSTLGLTVGTCIEVISNHTAGPIIIATHGSRTALTGDLAQQIMVTHSCRHADHE
ncbi:MAG: transcriptional repressor [Desulfobulbaceae bacterium]|nr:transcriptional repressor [Desulfobulbaceae bacterium]